MFIALAIIEIVIGLFLVLKGADFLTDGASGIATKLNIPQIIIGITIVGMGTSMPECCVSVLSALNGAAGMAVGNIVGSNIFNVLLIIGTTAAIIPLSVDRNTVRKDIPIVCASTMLLLFFCMDNSLSRIEGFILLLCFCLFMAYTIREARKSRNIQAIENNTNAADTNEDERDEDKNQNSVKDIDEENDSNRDSSIKLTFFVLLGLTFLIVGSNVFVTGASAMASVLGVGDAIIGLTIAAGGTSLPELSTTIAAAKKGQSAMAIGNIIGSIVFNILMALGITSIIQPLNISGISYIDYLVMLSATILFWLFSHTKLVVERWEGGVLLAGFVAYMTHVIINA